MNQRSRNLQYLALGVSIVLLLGAIFWRGAGFYHFFSRSLAVFSPSSTSTVTISAQHFAELETLKRENQTLRQQLTAVASTTTSLATSSLLWSDSYQAVSVIGRPPQSPYDTIIINQGGDHGIQKGQPVWWPAGVYLGRVMDVSPRSSVVELVSSDGVTHAGKIAETPVEVTGYGGDGLYGEIPSGISAAVGDVVFSDVYELPIGVVVAVEERNARNMQALYISRFAASPSLETVYVSQE